MNTENVENKSIVCVNNKQDTSAFHSSTPKEFSIFLELLIQPRTLHLPSQQFNRSLMAAGCKTNEIENNIRKLFLNMLITILYFAEHFGV